MLVVLCASCSAAFLSCLLAGSEQRRHDNCHGRGRACSAQSTPHASMPLLERDPRDSGAGHLRGALVGSGLSSLPEPVPIPLVLAPPALPTCSHVHPRCQCVLGTCPNVNRQVRASGSRSVRSSSHQHSLNRCRLQLFPAALSRLARFRKSYARSAYAPRASAALCSSSGESKSERSDSCLEPRPSQSWRSVRVAGLVSFLFLAVQGSCEPYQRVPHTYAGNPRR